MKETITLPLPTQTDDDDITDSDLGTETTQTLCAPVLDDAIDGVEPTFSYTHKYKCTTSAKLKFSFNTFNNKKWETEIDLDPYSANQNFTINFAMDGDFLDKVLESGGTFTTHSTLTQPGETPVHSESKTYQLIQ